MTGEKEQLTYALRRFLTATTRQEHLMWLKHSTTLAVDVDKAIMEKSKAPAAEIVLNEVRSMENPKKFLQLRAKARNIV